MFIPVSQLFATGRSPCHPVAVRKGRAVLFSQFRADVGHNAARLRATDSQCATLICGDSYLFVVGLLSLFHAGIDVVIAHNTQRGTLAALDAACDLFVLQDSADGVEGVVLEIGVGDAGHVDPYDPETVSINHFTSGSTGDPKPATRTALMLEREVEALRDLDVIGNSLELVSSTVPHQHVYGLTFKLLWPLSCGRPFSAVSHDLWETALQELEPGGVLVTSPAHLTRLAGIEPLAPERALGWIVSAGAPLPSKAAREAAAILGTAPTEIFGSTETGCYAVRPTVPPDQPWQPLPGFRFDLTEDGRLKILSSAVPGTCWYVTPEIARRDASGAYHFEGRADRVVKVEGKRVNLPDVEIQLTNLSWVAEAAVTVVGKNAPRLGAVVKLEDAGKKKLAELGNFKFGQLLRHHLAETQDSAGLPRVWRFVDSLPTGNLGKRHESDLRALFAQDDIR